MLLVILIFSTYTNGAPLPSKPLTLQEIHLVRCLTHISQRYFAPERSVVISSPSTYQDVQQELIAEIQKISVWPVVVNVDGNIRITNFEADFTDRDGSYIVLIPDGNIESLMTEIVSLEVDETNYTGLWNSEARFVVAGANKFSIRQQRIIFNYFSKSRLYNCIIISQGHNVVEKKQSRQINVNYVDKHMKFEVYTWFPYQSSDRCTEVNDITLLDSWVISAQGHFTRNTDLFPRKISNSLEGCPMIAFVRPNWWQYHKSYTGGPEVDLLEVVLKQMNMTLVYFSKPENFEIPSDIIKSMLVNEFHIALGGMESDFKRAFQSDITNPHFSSTYRWYVPCPVKYPRWNSIFRILSLELWLVLIISVIIAAILATVIGRYSCTSEWQSYKTLRSSFTHIWAVILGVAVSNKPRTPSLRSLFLSWVCFSLAFSTVFQVFLTTFIIDPGHKPPIRNLDELFASGIKFFYTLEFEDLFSNSVEKEESNVEMKFADCESFHHCFSWAVYGKNVSILMREEWFDVTNAAGDFLEEDSKPLLCKLEDGLVYTSGLSMVMLYGDPQLRRVTEITDRVFQAGIYKHWNSLLLHQIKLDARKIRIVLQLEDYYSFNMFHMQPAFYLLLMGWCLTAICFMIELLYHRIISKRL
jgi:hypothetical protein